MVSFRFLRPFGPLSGPGSESTRESLRTVLFDGGARPRAPAVLPTSSVCLGTPLWWFRGPSGAAAAAEGPGRRRGAVRRPPRHRRDVSTTAWRWGSLTARFGQHGHVVAEMYPTHWLIPTQVNDGVQNKEESYGKFEAGNKLSLLDFAQRVEAPTDWLETTLVPVWKSHFRRPTPSTLDNSLVDFHTG